MGRLDELDLTLELSRKEERKRSRARPAARLPLLVAAVLAAGAAGCGSDVPALPAGCRAEQREVAAALHRVPAAVRLSDGTRLSTCVARARADADLQEIGLTFTHVADGLAAQVPRSNAAAVQLGYLIAAVRRGAGKTNGVATELARRIEQTVGLDGPPGPRRAAFQRGLAAGARTG